MYHILADIARNAANPPKYSFYASVGGCLKRPTEERAKAINYSEINVPILFHIDRYLKEKWRRMSQKRITKNEIVQKFHMPKLILCVYTIDTFRLPW